MEGKSVYDGLLNEPRKCSIICMLRVTFSKIKKETHEMEKWAYLIDIKLVDEVR